MDFKPFKLAVAAQFGRMAKHQLFRTSVDKDALWDTYLGSFPEGSNPIFKERTEHDCNCCKQFIRAVGNAVAIIDGQVVSIWDVKAGDPNYQAVADALSALVKSRPIADEFLHYERTAGTDRNFQDTVAGVQAWDHFFVNIPQAYVVKGADIASRLSESRSSHDVLARSLAEITDDAVATVLELIAQGSLYRGEEHKFVVDAFRKLKADWKRQSPAARDAFVWVQCTSKVLPASVSRVRNTVIGTLMTDLAEDKDLDAAVASFEAMVAPMNYKRPTALITKAMIEKAKETIKALGLTSALLRRYATINDITINNIIFADAGARATLTGSDVFDELASKVPVRKLLDQVAEVSIEAFLTDILPRATSLELMVDNAHEGNFMSLIAPAEPTARRLFKWGNQFSWSYNGEMADSVKERVKKAGGNVTGDLCCRLAWYNHDDLDFHMIEPSGYEIYFGSRGRKSPNGGDLDVDMNAGMGKTRQPVENIFYGSRASMKEGVYILNVHNFAQRETVDVGFEVELDFMGTVHRFVHEKAVKTKSTVTVVKFNYSKKDGIKFIESLPSTQASREVWGMQTQTFQKVNVMMMSPNHWDGQNVGNKHYFFMLEGCLNSGTARGFFNEFLIEELNPHRKVIEVVGSKMKAEASSSQLSGLGFSSTQRNSVLCRVKGAFSRVVKIVF